MSGSASNSHLGTLVAGRDDLRPQRRTHERAEDRHVRRTQQPCGVCSIEFDPLPVEGDGERWAVLLDLALASAAAATIEATGGAG